MKYLIADHSHDAALRGLLAGAAMPGPIRLAFGRDPDFFQGLGVQGKQNQALVAVAGDQAVGLGCRSIKPVYLNGHPVDVGYLSGLRLLPGARHTAALARGYALLKELHADGRAPFYLSTIIESNQPAISLLTSARAGLPQYEDYGRFLTYAILVGKRKRRHGCHTPGVTVVSGTQISWERIIRFLNQAGKRRQFFPVLDPADLGTPYLRDLRVEDFHVAICGNEIAGVAASWDQSNYKQIILRGYSGFMRMVRPLANGLLPLAGYQPLPAPGARLSSSYVSFICVAQDDPRVLAQILDHIYDQAQAAGRQFMLAGFHEQDPLRIALQPFRTIQYTSRLYLVGWDDHAELRQTLDQHLCPYLELGAL